MRTPRLVARIIGFSCSALLLMSGTLAAGAPEIITREQWHAKPPAMEMTRHRPLQLTIHHTATPANPKSSIEKKLKSLQAFSQSGSKLADGRTKKAWADVPYHFYIDVLGAVAEGRAVDFVGDTNTNYDPRGHIGIVVEGNFEDEAPSAAQISSLVALLAVLAKRHGIDPGDIGTHRQFAQTACPGKLMMALLPKVVANVKKRLQQQR